MDNGRKIAEGTPYDVQHNPLSLKPISTENGDFYTESEREDYV